MTQSPTRLPAEALTDEECAYFETWYEARFPKNIFADCRGVARVAYEHALSRSLAANAPVAQSAPKCMACDGHGLIGGFVSADSGYESEICQDCDGSGLALAPVAQPALSLTDEQREAIEEAICWARDEGLPGTADTLRSILDGATNAPVAQPAGAVLVGSTNELDLEYPHATIFAAFRDPKRGEVPLYRLAAPTHVPESSGGDGVVGDLTALVERLVRALHKANLGIDLPYQAMDYLRRHNLIDSPLRVAPSPEPATRTDGEKS